MKKLYYPALLVLALVLAYFAITSFSHRSGRYLIYEGYVPQGTNEAGVIMLDTQTGRTWSLVNNVWQPIKRVGEEKTLAGPDPDRERALLAEEIERYKRQQEHEINQIKAKYTEEYSALLKRLEEHLGTDVKQPSATGSGRTSSSKAKKPSASSRTTIPEEGAEEAAPGWLTD
jgi:hypothetical protein